MVKEKTESGFWKTSRRIFDYRQKVLVMGILNVTPDSFSDGGRFFSLDESLRQAEKLIEEGADILDVGGESTRPNSARVSAEVETGRVIPVIEAVTKRFDTAISIDTSKSEVAERAIESGAEIINDVSGLRFDKNTAKVAAKYQTGLVLMHLRGTFETMHKQAPSQNILRDVAEGFHRSVEKARRSGVKDECIALDAGIGFSKTFGQNLELLARLGELCVQFRDFPMLVGASRKSFIGKLVNEPGTEKRLFGSVASAAIAVLNGARIVRVHDVRETIQTIRVADAIKNWDKYDV